MCASDGLRREWLVVLLQMLRPTYSATVVRRCVRVLAYGAHGKRATREPIRATEPPLYPPADLEARHNAGTFEAIARGLASSPGRSKATALLATTFAVQVHSRICEKRPWQTLGKASSGTAKDGNQ